MEKSNLIKGRKYVFHEPCTGKQEVVIYSHETLNHFVFDGDTFKHLITNSMLKTNIREL